MSRRHNFAIIRAIDVTLEELQRQAGGTLDPTMLLEARNHGIAYGISLLKSLERSRRARGFTTLKEPL